MQFNNQILACVGVWSWHGSFSQAHVDAKLDVFFCCGIEASKHFCASWNV
jgi:hypothetical protein